MQQPGNQQAMQAQTEVGQIMKDGLNNLSAGGGLHQVGGPSLYDMNLANTN